VIKNPVYHKLDGKNHNLMLAVEAMKRHSTNEGWQLQIGLRDAGYKLRGSGFEDSCTDVKRIIEKENPSTVIVQDKREWDGKTTNRVDTSGRFSNIQYLKDRSDIFKLTVLKDAHQNTSYHKESATEIGCHAWVTYYHQDSISKVAPYLRPEHCIRTYHSLNPNEIPELTPNRKPCVLSGAVSPAHYPLRHRLFSECCNIFGCDLIRHGGYHTNGPDTPEYLEMLAGYKVSICTCSIYGYALRKIMESTACGCVVITNLPSYEKLPIIDENLVRIPNDFPIVNLSKLVWRLWKQYDFDRQMELSRKCVEWYDYKNTTSRLATDIENLRQAYNG
jgi:hypothetical protein